MTPAIPSIFLGPPAAYKGPGTFSLTSTVPQAASRMLLPEASVWTAINIRLNKTGSPTLCTVTVTIQTEASGVPSGTVVTNATATFTAGATGWSGAISFAGNVSLAANTPYWLVVGITSTGTFDASSNYYQWYAALDQGNAGSYERQFTSYTASAWITPPTTGKWGSCWMATMTSPTSGYYGLPYTSGSSMSITGITRIGLRIGVDALTVIRGVWLYLGTNGSTVNNLTLSIYADADNSQQGSTFTLIRSNYFGVQTQTTPQPILIDFGADVTLAPGYYWISLYSSGSNTNQWQIAYMYGDLDTGATSRGALNQMIGTRTADTGAWTTYSPAADAFYQFLVSNQTQVASGGGEAVFGSSVVQSFGGGILG